MAERLHFDMSAVSFDQFVAFLFDHEVVPERDAADEGPEPWYWNVDVDFDATRVTGYYIRLFGEPSFLLTRNSSAQLEQGFWAIQSDNLPCAVSEMIWRKEVPLEIRESCIRSMHHLFEKFFAVNPLDTSANMWWDSLAYDWHCGNRSRGRGDEDDQIQDVMFETLQRILTVPTLECQAAALHGLGHLHHPHTSAAVSAYLERNPMLSADMREYALAAARFEVM